MKTKILPTVLFVLISFISLAQTTITFDDRGFSNNQDITTPLLSGISGYRFEYLQNDVQKFGTRYINDGGFGNSGYFSPPLLFRNQKIRISRVDGKPFKLNEFFTRGAFGNSVGMNFTGYLGTVPVATQSTTALNNGQSRTITLNVNFGNVTSVVIDDNEARFGLDASFDHFVFEQIIDNTAPSGYTIAWNDTKINATEAPSTSFTITGGEIGDVVNYRITSSGDGNTATITSSVAISSIPQTVTVDVSSLPDGVLTNRVTLTDPSGNIGVAVSSTATLDKIVPGGYSVSWSDTLINATEASYTSSFTIRDVEIGNTMVFSITSSGDPGSPVSSTPFTMTSNTQNFPLVLNSIPDGVLTIEVTITDPAGNVGPTVSDNSATLDKTAPSGYSVEWDRFLINTVQATTANFAIRGGEIGTTATYEISSAGDSNTATITNSILITSDPQFFSVNLSTLSDGVLTTNLTLTDLAGNAGDVVIDNSTTLDQTPPTGYLATWDDVLINASEAATASFTVENVEVNSFIDYTISSSGDGNTATITKAATMIFSDPQTVTVDISSLTDGVLSYDIKFSDPAYNPGTPTISGNDVTLDTNAPTGYTVTIDQSPVNAGNDDAVSFTFAGAEIGATYDYTFSSAGGGTSVTGTGIITTTADQITGIDLSSLGDGTITLEASLTDPAGNSGATVMDTKNKDVALPTATIAINDSELSIGETTNVTITFSEVITGFNNADLTIPNGTLSTVSSTDGNITFTATYTPNTNIEDATNIITLDNTGVTDNGGNAGIGTTDSTNFVIDTASPTSTITISDNELTVAETAIVTITFSEPVTNFDTTDLTIPNGTLSTLSSSDGNITFTAIFTPTEGIEDPTNIITLDNTGVTDTIGNAGIGTTDATNFVINTIVPISTITISDNELIIGETATVIITFSEPVTGFDNTNLTVPNGTLSTVSSTDGNITFTATYTPNDDIEDDTNIIILDNTAITNNVGNAGIGTTDSTNFVIDTTSPTSTITISDNELTIEETATVTITFSEPVTGFDNTNLTVPNGTLSTVSSTDGNITFTATYTPNDDIEDDNNIITIDNTGVVDALGNPGIDTTNSENFSINTQNVTPASTTLTFNKGFSPNGDGINDTWVIEGLENFPNHQIQLFNRTGNPVFKSRQYQNDWNGISQGSSTFGNGKLPSGAYYYVIETGNTEVAPLTGWIYINY
ncbi:gliding motility-associated-like protein [Aquimarina sp. MAR_2010_214]|uniref:Ig-like domain-containing protein n=1 Tax=Aquimarina sp. MAR_2010_214 TaxID=1250026 RepID=UPI000C703B16|nr:Ig-like domain-containing protein [Aquimarina sp. MAR_2010_214]PKV48296.1 gliding motility-associated-like protein [Aquimarina sp. MAR_2010_214]